jgi:tRNA (cmo5U34)-methyltransferase
VWCKGIIENEYLRISYGRREKKRGVRMQQEARMRENWFDPVYVKQWLDGQDGRTAERLRHFAMIRSLIPRSNRESFRVLDVGGGDGWLAEVLLTRFSSASVTVLDQSEVMLGSARERLRSFGDRARTAQGDLRTAGWPEGLGLYDVAVSTIAIHNLGDPSRIRALYGEIFEILADDGCFLTLDYVRAPGDSVGGLTRWASSDPEAGYTLGYRRGGQGGGGRGGRERGGREPEQRGTLEEQLGWLREAGFSPVECFWKEFQTALFGGFKGTLRVPEER